MKLTYLTLYVFILTMTACSSHHRPAPVVDIVSSPSSTLYQRGSIDADYHIVNQGETLYSIAWRANIDVNTLAQVNDIYHPYKIFPGQKILLSEKITQARSDKTSKQNPNNYSRKKPKKELKKAIDSKKNQEYGGSVSGQKASKKAVNSVNSGYSLTPKISAWQWPSTGKVLSYFSTSTQGNKGLDIAGKKGDKIVAAADGIVVYVGNALRGYGRLVIIKHNEDYLSAYAHNDKILVKEQQFVKAGQQIAKMGDSDAERVMLHFEVRFRGKSVNPMKYLPRK